MSQEIYNDKSDDASSLMPQDSALTSKNVSRSPAEVIQSGKSFSERWKTNRFWLIKGSYFFLRTVWLIVMAIAGFIAWLIAMLFI